MSSSSSSSTTAHAAPVDQTQEYDEKPVRGSRFKASVPLSYVKVSSYLSHVTGQINRKSTYSTRLSAPVDEKNEKAVADRAEVASKLRTLETNMAKEQAIHAAVQDGMRTLGLLCALDPEFGRQQVRQFLGQDCCAVESCPAPEVAKAGGKRRERSSEASGKEAGTTKPRGVKKGKAEAAVAAA